MHAENPITRRRFVSTTAALGAAGFLAAPSFARRPLGRGVDPLRVGIVGCGGRGTGALVQALRADEGSVLWAMGDVFADRIEPCLGHATEAMLDLAEETGETNWSGKIQVDASRRYSGFDAFQRVIDSGVDVVILTTPPAFRPEHLAACVKAGKHVFCEKPVAVDAPGVRSVLESARLAKQKKLSIMSGFCWRYQDQVREAFTKLQSGGIGDIHTLQTTYNTTGWVTPKVRKSDWSDTEFQVRNWHYFHPISGDHIVEQAVHAIDWIGWALGDGPPERCWAVGGRATRPDKPETGNVYDHFSITYEYPGGVRAYHMCRHWPNTASDNTGYFLGSKGKMTMRPWNGHHVIEGDTPWRGTAGGNDMYQREHDLLFKAIRTGEPHNDGVAMAHSTLLAIMGRMSAYTGQTVTWEQALASSENLNPDVWAFADRATPELAIPGRTKFV